MCTLGVKPLLPATSATVLCSMKTLKWERPWLVELATVRVAATGFPKFIVWGGWSNGFEALCDCVATKIGAERIVFEHSTRAVQHDSAEFNPFLKNVVESAHRGNSGDFRV